MANRIPAELRELLARDLPGSLVSVESRSAMPIAPPAHKPAPANLLATDDVVVQPSSVPAVANYLRERLGYELLSNITAVDHLRDNVIEVIYHFAHLNDGMTTIKARIPRDEPKLPSLAGQWPGADFQEREAYDLFGVVFLGHPNLSRIYMWDEFDGFPMRKDFPKQGDKYLATGE